MEKNEILVPFLKWAGGKRWLVSTYPEILNLTFHRYIEPFLGSGAIFFSLAPNKAILADRNEELIEAYQAIKDDWNLVQKELRKHHTYHSKSYYYGIRQSKPRRKHTRAARFIYLNRTCWNGLYRVNLKGQFNVPIGTKTNVILDTDNFEAISKLLKSVDLKVCDFESTIAEAGNRDLLFIDPPYTVKHNYNGFIKYNENLFSWDDQIRLRDSVEKAIQRGALVVLTNAYHNSVKVLYKNIGIHRRLKRQSVLAADSNKRKICDELLVVVE